MSTKHEPDGEFVERLEWQIRRQARIRNRSAGALRRVTRSRWKVALATAALVAASIGIGVIGTAAAFQVKSNERRDLLIGDLERRAELARQRVTVANGELQTTQGNLSLGLTSQRDVLEARVKVAQADAELKSIGLQIEEVRITGGEPLNEVSSPLVSGRDFVTERLRVEMSVPDAALELERANLQAMQKRVSLGTADPMQVDVARVRVLEVEAAAGAFRRKIEIRQQFLSRSTSAEGAELRVLESEAETRQKTLAPKVELARKQSQRATASVRTGTGSRVEQAEAMLRLQQLESEMAQADLDLVLVRRQLEQRRSGR